jgi:hypothetical protein
MSMKKDVSTLRLSRETLRILQQSDLSLAAAGGTTGIACPYTTMKCDMASCHRTA